MKISKLRKCCLSVNSTKTPSLSQNMAYSSSNSKKLKLSKSLTEDTQSSSTLSQIGEPINDQDQISVETEEKRETNEERHPHETVSFPSSSSFSSSFQLLPSVSVPRALSDSTLRLPSIQSQSGSDSNSTEQKMEITKSSSSAHEQEKKKKYSKFNRRLKILQQQEIVKLSRHTPLVVILALTVYTFIGAGIFQAIEGSYDVQAAETFNKRCIKARAALLNQLKTNCSRKSFESCASRTREVILAVDSCLREYSGPGLTLPTSSKYWNCVIFAFSVYTTLGYGNVVLWTRKARIFYFLYAFFGVPFFVATCKSCSVVLRSICLHAFYYCSDKFAEIKRRVFKPKEQEQNSRIVVGVSRISESRRLFPEALVAFTLYLLLLSFFFRLTLLVSLPPETSEGWSYFRTFYFVYTSVTMIGFGDVFPEKEEILVIYLPFFFAGMCLYQVVLYPIQEEMREQGTTLSRNIRMVARKFFVFIRNELETL